MKLTDKLTPTAMLVMYLNDNRGTYNTNISTENVYFEYAPIVKGQVGAMIPLSNHAAGALGNALVQLAKVEIGGYVPSNLMHCGLGNSDPSLLWWTKPGKRRLLYNIPGVKDLTFNMPWLVWYYHRNTLYLYAAKEQPQQTTRLYHAPFGNITNGAVCLGSGTTVLNKGFTSFEEMMQLVELAFFGTKFTHQSEDRVVKGNMMSLHKRLNGTDDPFPDDVLLKTRRTVKSLINGQIEDTEDED